MLAWQFTPNSLRIFRPFPRIDSLMGRNIPKSPGRHRIGCRGNPQDLTTFKRILRVIKQGFKSITRVHFPGSLGYITISSSLCETLNSPIESTIRKRLVGAQARALRLRRLGQLMAPLRTLKTHRQVNRNGRSRFKLTATVKEVESPNKRIYGNLLDTMKPVDLYDTFTGKYTIHGSCGARKGLSSRLVKF